MTNEEAIEDLIWFVKIRTSKTPEFVSVAIEALEKQIPKEPTSQHFANEQYMHFCPDCGTKVASTNITSMQDGEYVLASGGDKYCRNCGKRLRWTND